MHLLQRLQRLQCFAVVNPTFSCFFTHGTFHLTELHGCLFMCDGIRCVHFAGFSINTSSFLTKLSRAFIGLVKCVHFAIVQLVFFLSQHHPLSFFFYISQLRWIMLKSINEWFQSKFSNHLMCVFWSVFPRIFVVCRHNIVSVSTFFLRKSARPISAPPWNEMEFGDDLLKCCIMAYCVVSAGGGKWAWVIFATSHPKSPRPPIGFFYSKASCELPFFFGPCLYGIMA